MLLLCQTAQGCRRAVGTDSAPAEEWLRSLALSEIRKKKEEEILWRLTGEEERNKKKQKKKRAEIANKIRSGEFKDVPW